MLKLPEPMLDSFQTIGVIGYGRFSRLLLEIFRKKAPHADLRVFSRTRPEDGELFFPHKLVCASDLIIPCVPIRCFSGTVQQLAGVVKEGQTLMDVCSVKVHPREVMQKLLPAGVHLVASHPMFGPASYRKLGGTLQGCSMVIENVRAFDSIYSEIVHSFESLGLTMIEMDAEEHDRLAARFHFITLSAATLLKQLQLRRSRIDTRSASAMLDFLEMISVDRELVKDLYDYNAHCRKEFESLESLFKGLQNYLKDNDR